MESGTSALDQLISAYIFLEGVVTWPIQPIIVLGGENFEATRFTLADIIALVFQIGLAGTLTIGQSQSTVNIALFAILVFTIVLLWRYAVRKLSMCDIVSFARRFVALTVVFPLWLSGMFVSVFVVFALLANPSLLTTAIAAGWLAVLFVARATANYIAASEADSKLDLPQGEIQELPMPETTDFA